MTTHEHPIIGQRWISENDTQLGLGIIIAVDDRTATLMFPSSEESRTYALRQSTIARIRFSPGDRVYPAEGSSFIVESVHEHDGILTYHGINAEQNPCQISESRLGQQIHLTRPLERMLSGQLDSMDSFNLRYKTLLYRQQLRQHPCFGLLGPRINLLPHQIYVAHEVSDRHAPRVLLADEAGLGKTIEAGLIIHRQLLQNKIQRILIVVPQTVQYQWLVELLRRFNLCFSLLDAERLAEERIHNPDLNPLLQQQWVLLSLEQLVDDKCLQTEAMQGQFDLMVVDEAHHLTWEEQNPSEAYQIIERLGSIIPALLLLTATPGQLGLASHFARLRLLDPNNFHNPNQLKQQEKTAHQIANLATILAQSDQALTRTQLNLLQKQLPDQVTEAQLTPDDATRYRWLTALLDRHGTGRVMFRNTRANTPGFMPRHLKIYRYSNQDSAFTNPHFPFLPDLLALLKKFRREKLLLITHSTQTVLLLDEVLRLREGIPTSMFHEQMTLVERDRAAAYFADQESGARIMLCSEIGSEGRNFQFCHHLIFFDLPDNPDLLEQRIGRLDRIGQPKTIYIHAFVASGSREERLLEWYHLGLDAFERTCAIGSEVMTQLSSQLLPLLEQPNHKAWPSLIEQTKTIRTQLEKDLRKGHDRLVEFNSCRPERLQPWMEALQHTDSSTECAQYMNEVFNCFGVDIEDQGEEQEQENLYILRPTDHMLMEQFPGLSAEGLTLTYSRTVALQREDIPFITWEHPMVQSCMDLIEQSEIGNTNVALLRNRAVAPGTILLEALFLPELPVPRSLNLQADMEQAFIRVLLDRNNNDLSQKVSHHTLNRQLHALQRSTARILVHKHESLLRTLLTQAEYIALNRMQPLLEQAQEKTRLRWQYELDRLHALRRINPAVRQVEIDHVASLLAHCLKALVRVNIQLYAIRLVIAE